MIFTQYSRAASMAMEFLIGGFEKKNENKRYKNKEMLMVICYTEKHTTRNFTLECNLHVLIEINSLHISNIKH
jgi:hypothetical protein